jgi:hypothetical protein
MASVPRLKVVGNVGHLVKECVDALGAVPLEHEIHVERDLFNAARAIHVSVGQHVSERRHHAAAQPDRNVVGEVPVETRQVEVAVEYTQISSLLRSSAARCHDTSFA